MMKALPILLLMTVIAAGIAVGLLRHGRARDRARVGAWGGPIVTLAVALLVAAGLGAQLLHPPLLALLERNCAAIHDGEIWRIVTSLFVQDGGLAGGIFNIVMLLAVGAVAERSWCGWRWLLLYAGCGVVGEVLACAWQPVGGGNSIAYLGLCGGLFALGFLRRAGWAGLALSAIGISAGIALLVEHDIHGTAVLLGMALGFVLAMTGGAAADGS